MGFGYAKLIDGNVLEMAYPISACKDFLLEEVVSEWNGVNYDVFGLISCKKNIFDVENDKGYLVFSILPYKTGGEYANQSKDIALLESNYKKIEKLLNSIEDLLKVENKTKIEKIQDNKFVAIHSLFWTKKTYLISLYSLLIRVGVHYETEEGPIVFLKNFKKVQEDYYMISTAIPKLKRMIKGYYPPQNLNEIDNPHNMGIVSFDFPLEKSLEFV